jgi:hypothetical protein
MMQKHVTVVGVIRIGWGVMGVLLAALVLAGTVGTGFMLYTLEGNQEILPLLSGIGIPVTLFILVLSVPNIVAGIGVLKLKQWARYLSMVLAVLDLINVPIGTAIGVYTLVVMVMDGAAELFSSPPST